MSQAVKTPVNQKLLTNVAVVRYKGHGNRFEIACYKNKVLSWRAGVEKDLDEVLQIDQVFSNVGKGIKAKPADMQKTFGTTDHNTICRTILEKGELQLSEKEREHHLELMFRDIVHIVTSKCVDADTERPITAGVVEKMMREAHVALNLNQTAKMQALEVIKTLQSRFPIKRAAMRLRLTIPSGGSMSLDSAKSKLKPFVKAFEPVTESNALIFLIAPGSYREIDDLVARAMRGCALEVISVAVQDVSVAALEPGGAAQNDSAAAAAAKSEAKGPKADEIDDEAVIIIPAHVQIPTAEQLAHMPRPAPQQLAAQLGPVKFPATGAESSESAASAVPAAAAAAAAPAPAAANSKLSCNTCNAKFSDPRQHREHFKSEWHRFNLKRKVDGQAAVEESLFEQLSLLEPAARDDIF